jgi:hypothetical protein
MQRTINLLVATDRTKDQRRIAADLRSAGLHITRELPRIGVITGSADEHTVGRLRDVGGVLKVEAEWEYRFPSPSSPVQ